MSILDSIKNHVHHLSVEIGPRGSATPQEKRAAAYAEEVYKSLGLTPITEEFRSAKSAWHPFALSTFLVLASELIFLYGDFLGAIVASLITGLMLISLVQELSFKANPLRWILPKGQSQNVSAVIEPYSEVKQSIVLVGHLDTHRTPISHRSLRWFSIFNRLTTLTFVSAILMLILFLIQIFFIFEIVVYITIILSIPVLLLFPMAFTADFTPYSTGANDNASGAAMTMGLAEKATSEPLQNSRVWAVNVGCEEVGAYGSAAWLESHLDEIGDAVYLNLDNIGGSEAGPCYLTRETMIFPFVYDTELIALADRLAEENPELRAYSREQKAAYTDGALGIKAGLSCLTFVGYTPEGVIPHWHQQSDVFENIDWDVMERTFNFVWLLMKAIDERVA
ncbi:MAG: M28 family metallopeptidase [Candidatus Thorarchaeota archaeon]